MLTVAEFLRQIPRAALEARANESTERARAALADGLAALQGVDISVFRASLIKTWGAVSTSTLASGIKTEAEQALGLVEIFLIVGTMTLTSALDQLQLEENDPPPTRPPVDRMKPGKN